MELTVRGYHETGLEVVQGVKRIGDERRIVVTAPASGHAVGVPSKFVDVI